MAFAALALPALAAEPPDQEIHALRQLARRGRVKPFERLALAEGKWRSERVVYKDATTGTTAWRMSGTPGVNRHDAFRSPWNADGSLLALTGIRGERGGTWLARTDGSGWQWFGWGWSAWSADDPKIAFVLDGGAQELQRADALTGEKTALWKLPAGRTSLSPPSPDGKWLLVIENPQDRNGAESWAWIIDAAGTGLPRKFKLADVTHEAWFLKRADAAFLVDYERPQDREYKDGMFLCDVARGGTLNLLDPVHFQNGVASPSGKMVAHLRRDIVVFDVAKGENRPLARLANDRGVFLSWGCEDAWLLASLGNQVATVASDTGKISPVCVPNTQLGYGGWNTESQPVASPDGTKVGYASTMLGDIDFYVAVRRLPDPPREVTRKGTALTWKAPARCRELAGYHIWKDGKLLKRELSRETGCEVEMGGTYAVTAVEHSGLESEHTDTTAPRAPAGVQCGALDAWTVEIGWDAPDDLDVVYYNVYCGPGAEKRASAARVASTPATRHVEWGLSAGAEYAIAVTAVDGAGNESASSAASKVKTPRSPAFHKVIPVNKRAPVDITVDLPEPTDVVVWVSLRQLRAGQPPPLRVSIDGDQPRNWQARWDLVGGLGPGVDPPPIWDLLPGPRGGAQLQTMIKGDHKISIVAPDGQVEIASIIITADQAFVPEGVSSFLARKPK
mgnify:CR=1 FL=1